MPIFDGLSAAETILQEELAACVVLLTAFCDKDIIWRANQIGVTGYLTKPIDARSILPTLEVAYSQSVRLAEQKKQTREIKNQIQESRQIFRAQKYLARTQGCSETEAYQKMRKEAMDKRMSIAALAERILKQAAQTDEVTQARPNSMGSLYQNSIIGEYALREKEPAVFHALEKQMPVRDMKATAQENGTVRQDAASSISLVVNELITNSLKHAFADREEGALRVSFRSGSLFDTVTVADDGVEFDFPRCEREALACGWWNPLSGTSSMVS